LQVRAYFTLLYVVSLINGSCDIAPLTDDKGVMVLPELEKANLLNKYITSVYTHDSDRMDQAYITSKSPSNRPMLCSDRARCLKVGVHEKPSLSETFHERRTRELGGEYGGLPSPRKNH